MATGMVILRGWRTKGGLRRRYLVVGVIGSRLSVPGLFLRCFPRRGLRRSWLRWRPRLLPAMMLCLRWSRDGCHIWGRLLRRSLGGLWGLPLPRFRMLCFGWKPAGLFCGEPLVALARGRGRPLYTSHHISARRNGASGDCWLAYIG